MRKVAVSTLTPGMFVERAGEGSFSSPNRVYRWMLTEPEDIAAIAADGYGEVWVDESRSLPDIVNLSPELARSVGVYVQTLGYIRRFMDSVRGGGQVQWPEVGPIVDQVVGDVLAGEKRLKSLAKLRRYDEYTYSHCVNVGVFSVVFGRSMGASPEELTLLCAAGLLHDAGKARIPLEILNKPGKLSDPEMAQMRRHAELGQEVLGLSPEIPEGVVRAASEHHERYDGSGYPLGRRAGQIATISTIISLCDVYDAMTSNRVYQSGRTPHEVLAKMYGWKGKDFHPELVLRFIRCMGIYPEGTVIRLSDGRVAVIRANNPKNLLGPTVAALQLDNGVWRRQEVIDLSVQAGLTIKSVEDSEALGVDGLGFLAEDGS